MKTMDEMIHLSWIKPEEADLKADAEEKQKLKRKGSKEGIKKKTKAGGDGDKSDKEDKKNNSRRGGSKKKGKYTDDIRMENQAYAAFVRSPHAHARVNSYTWDDATRAFEAALAEVVGA